MKTRRVPWFVQALLFAGGVLLLLCWWLPVRRAVYWSVGLGLVLAAGRTVAGQADLQLADAAIVDRARRGESGEPRDGERIAVFGTLEPAGVMLDSPLRDKSCVAYHYQAYHHESRTGSSSGTTVIDYAGVGIVPLLVQRESSAVALGGYPWFADFAPLTAITSEEELEKGRRALEALRFADVSESELAAIELRQTHWNGQSPLLADYRRLRGRFDVARPVPPIGGLRLKERTVSSGVPVCAVGIWSAERNALIGTGDGMPRELWLWSGKPDDVHARVLGSSRSTRGCGWFLIAVAAATIAFLIARAV